MPEMQDLPTRLIKTITGETLAVKETKEEHYFEAGDPVWLLSDEGKAKGSIDELADDGASVVINETGVKVFAPYHLIVYRKVLI